MGIQEAEYWKQYREKNRERLREAARRRYAANPEKFRKEASDSQKRCRPRIRAYHKKWRDSHVENTKKHYENYMAKHKEKLYASRSTPEKRAAAAAYAKAYREKNLEKIKANMKEYYLAHKHLPEVKEQKRANSRKQYWKNPELARQQSSVRGKRRLPAMNARRRERRATDIQFVLADRMRANIGRALRRNWILKSKRTFEMVGCTVEELKLHLEKQFVGGMSWETRDKWHADHIIPIVAFDLTDAEEMKWAFNWQNLQPLPCLVNHQKSDKIPDVFPDWLPIHIQERIKSRGIIAATDFPLKLIGQFPQTSPISSLPVDAAPLRHSSVQIPYIPPTQPQVLFDEPERD